MLVMGLFDKLITRTLSLIGKHQQSKVAWLIIFLLCQALLDVVSVASMAPLALLITQPDAVFNNPALLHVFHSLHFTDVRNFSLLFLICLVAFLLVKHLVTVGIGNYRTHVAFAISGGLAQKVIRNFLQLPYSTYYELKSSHELNRIINLPTVFAHNILLPLATLFTEGCVMLLLTILLVIYSPWAMLFLGVALLPSVIFYQWNQQKIKTINNTIKVKYPQVLEKFLSLYDNLVEIKLYQKENVFSGKVESINQEVLSAQSDKNKIIFNSTRMIETTASLCLCLLIGYFIFLRSPADKAIAWISLFAAAAVRAIPSFNRMFVALLEIKSSVYVLEELKKYHSEQKFPDLEMIDFRQRIQFKDIHFGYPGHAPLLQGLSLVIEKGERIAITGKSGHGKTTLLLILMRFLKENHGALLVDDVAVTEKTIDAWRRHIAYVPQTAIILDGSILENITFGGDSREGDVHKVYNLLNSLGLGSWLSSLPDGLATRLGEKGIKISGGQRQRLAIARALYSNADLLLLDEMTNQLDSETEKKVWMALTKEEFKEKTIIIITHHDSLLEQCSAVYELEKGILARVDSKK